MGWFRRRRVKVRSWQRMSFLPQARGTGNGEPPFLIDPDLPVAYTEGEGAAGRMAVTAPPLARKVLRLRVLGRLSKYNAKETTFSFVLSRVRATFSPDPSIGRLVEDSIISPARTTTPFERTLNIPARQRELADNEYLAFSATVNGWAWVYLVAIEYELGL